MTATQQKRTDRNGREALEVRTIRAIDATVNPFGIAAMMEQEYGTFSMLSRENFADYIREAKKWEADDPGLIDRWAQTC